MTGLSGLAVLTGLTVLTVWTGLTGLTGNMESKDGREASTGEVDSGLEAGACGEHVRAGGGAAEDGDGKGTRISAEAPPSP